MQCMVDNDLGENAFFLERTDGLSTQGHRYFLAVNHESLLLEVWFEDALGATQREAHIVAELLAFSGKFTSCCHSFVLTYYLTILTIVPVKRHSVKVKSAGFCLMWMHDTDAEHTFANSSGAV